MKSHKERVQEYVRKEIPALKELSFGCRVQLQINHIEPYTTTGRLVGKNDWSDAGEFDHHREKKERLTIQAGWYRGDDYVITDFTPDKYTIIGHTPQLHHYLAVLEKHTQKADWKPMPYWFGLDIAGDEARLCAMYGAGVDEHYDYLDVHFSLTDGQPKSEKDWEIMSNILGV